MELPPLSALRVFEAASRQLSFTRAAETLGMTQAAVSYQIKLLEERVGGPLFLRNPKGLELTEMGARLAKPTVEAFELLRETYTQRANGPETLSISTITTISGNWLSHRLGRFQLANPDLAVRLDTDDKMTDFSRQDIDLTIRYGTGDWEGVESHLLFTSDLTPMLSPAILEKSGPITAPEDIVPLHWLNNMHRSWNSWLGQMGVPHHSCTPRRRFEMESQLHLSRSVLAGDGVAMLNPRFFRFELATGALIQPFAECWRSEKSYWLVYPHARRNRPAIKAFQRFLRAEIAAEDAALPAETASAAIRAAELSAALTLRSSHHRR